MIKSKFKVGDWVKFKKDHEHYASAHHTPLRFQIKRIEEDYDDDPLIWGGGEGCYEFRLEAVNKQTTFTDDQIDLLSNILDKQLQEAKKSFLDGESTEQIMKDIINLTELQKVLKETQ